MARARREAMEGEALAFRAELKLFQITDPSPALAIDKLNTEIAAIDALVTEALANMDADRLPSTEEIAGKAEDLRNNRRVACDKDWTDQLTHKTPYYRSLLIREAGLTER